MGKHEITPGTTDLGAAVTEGVRDAALFSASPLLPLPRFAGTEEPGAAVASAPPKFELVRRWAAVNPEASD